MVNTLINNLIKLILITECPATTVMLDGCFTKVCISVAEQRTKHVATSWRMHEVRLIIMRCLPGSLHYTLLSLLVCSTAAFIEPRAAASR